MHRQPWPVKPTVPCDASYVNSRSIRSIGRSRSLLPTSSPARTARTTSCHHERPEGRRQTHDNTGGSPTPSPSAPPLLLVPLTICPRAFESPPPSAQGSLQRAAAPAEDPYTANTSPEHPASALTTAVPLPPALPDPSNCTPLHPCAPCPQRQGCLDASKRLDSIRRAGVRQEHGPSRYGGRWRQCHMVAGCAATAAAAAAASNAAAAAALLPAVERGTYKAASIASPGVISGAECANR